MLQGALFKATVYLGGDLPFLKRFFGLSPHWQVPSIYTETVWIGGVLGSFVPGGRRTPASDAALRGRTPTIQGAKGVTGVPLLEIDRAKVIVCVLHLAMAMGRLTIGWLKRVCRDRNPDQRRSINTALTIGLTGCHLDKTWTPDGEETKRLLACIVNYLRPQGHLAHVRAQELNSIELLQNILTRLYRSTQKGDPDLGLHCKEVARRLKKFCFRGSKSSYLHILENDIPIVLAAIRPYGLAMYCQDTTESLNAKLKAFFLRFTSRGGGKVRNSHGGAMGALIQTMVYAFLYFHAHLKIHGKARPNFCRNTNLFDNDGGEDDPMDLDA